MFQEEFDKQGHRGCRGLMPENTIPAMLHALDLGVTTLEMDVVITKDRQVILSHEPFFNHDITTLPDGRSINAEEEKQFNVYQMTYGETRTYDVGMKPHPKFPQQKKIAAQKPRLSDLIDSVNHYQANHSRIKPFYNIETKTKPSTDGIFHPAPAEFVELLMTVIKEKQISDQVIVQSFDFRTLQYLHLHYPQIKTAMLIEGLDRRNLDEQVKELGFTPTIYSPAFQLVNKELVQNCHKLNMKIIPWTVNDKAGILRMKELGVDGLISDYPNLF